LDVLHAVAKVLMHTQITIVGVVAEVVRVVPGSDELIKLGQRAVSIGCGWECEDTGESYRWEKR